MRKIVWLFALFFSFRLDAQAPDQPAKPGPDQKRLEVFLGKWTNQGEANASPYGPAGRITATETFDWLPGGFFMIHRADGRQGTIESKWIEIIGYDARKKISHHAYVRQLRQFGSCGKVHLTREDAHLDGRLFCSRQVAEGTVPHQCRFTR